ncbi:DUF1223 domain-containing protein [Limnobacter humi]|uniref:DUF1223 domain-containing protein n=1 Tax=Limnobacter humi TaxID=1778671 RepID=A0ABT1WD31_9BURK|nr:DUF1223 domain-containing protein [Limnobacter humi]MCQ8894951.1 DUF1223 domain-containing protein [Limnobacter humi]
MKTVQKMWMNTAILSATLTAALPAMAAEQRCTWASPAHKVVLVELFTSEGCSSCPPADRWLSSRLKTPELATQVLPLAFHVDYWDYIGWKDPYGSPQYTARQYGHRNIGHTRGIYTPQVVMNSAESRDWNLRSTLSRQLATAQKIPVPWALQLETIPADSGKLNATVRIQDTEGAVDGEATVTVVLYEDGLTSAVNSGENRGEVLTHDGVVRRVFGPYPVSKVKAGIPIQALLPSAWKSSQLGVGAFVEARGTGEVLQALNAPKALSQCPNS